jgi:hypothetical protein
MAVNIEKKNAEAQRPSYFLVAVILRFKRPLNSDPDILRLIGFKLRKLGT